jgi:hypothetical protein
MALHPRGLCLEGTRRKEGKRRKKDNIPVSLADETIAQKLTGLSSLQLCGNTEAGIGRTRSITVDEMIL